MASIRSKELCYEGAHRLVFNKLLWQAHDGAAEGPQIPEVNDVIDLRRIHEEDARVATSREVSPLAPEPVLHEPSREEDVGRQQLAQVTRNIFELLDVERLRVLRLND